MPIIGLTHDLDGKVRIRRSVTCKVAIGAPPDPKDPHGHPTRLDHFVFLKRQVGDNTVRWVADDEKQKHYKEQCSGEPREFWITFLDDDPDKILRSEYAAWVATGRWCWGDGETATRKSKEHPDGAPFEPCANHSCPEIEKGTCAPSGDLYFMLADYPALGTICRLHTSSYQSIAEIRTALEEIRTITGGRLLGLRAKLFVRPDRSVYERQIQGEMKQVRGIKYVLGLQLAAQDLPQLAASMLETRKLFDRIREELGGKHIEVVEPDAERGDEITREFYPADRLLPTVEAEAEEAKPDARVIEAIELMEKQGINQAGIQMMLGQYEGRPEELLRVVQESTRKKEPPKPTAAVLPPAAAASSPKPAPPKKLARKGAPPKRAPESKTPEASPPASPPAPAKTAKQGWGF